MKTLEADVLMTNKELDQKWLTGKMKNILEENSGESLLQLQLTIQANMSPEIKVDAKKSQPFYVNIFWYGNEGYEQNLTCAKSNIYRKDLKKGFMSAS